MEKPLNKFIFLDNASTTKVNPQVLKKYNETIEDYFANPSSTHSEGQRGAYLLKNVHENLLKLLNLSNYEVILTSGATEANNLAIKGICFKYQNRGKHIITSISEHPSVLEAFKSLENDFGFKVTYLKTNEKGIINPYDIESAIKDDTILVSIMAVNNETGAINDVNAIADICHKHPKVIFHVDAVQAFGKLNLNYSKFDLFTFTAHKIHGLKGSGALFKKKSLSLLPLNSGGGQENNFRSGTNDLASAEALLLASSLAIKELKKNYDYVKTLRDEVLNYLSSRADLYELNSYSLENPYIINFSLRTKKASVVVEALSNKKILVSSVSACHSSKEKGSVPVMNMNKDKTLYMNTIRVSFSYENNLEEINAFINALDSIMKEVRR